MNSAMEKKEDYMQDVEKNLLRWSGEVLPPRKTSTALEQVLKHAHDGDGDEAMNALAEQQGISLVIDEATNRRLLWKIDRVLMPMMALVYMMNFLDKTTISYASIMGFKQDISLIGDNYNWVSSVFYFGYLAWEYPTNRLLQRLPLGKYSGFNIVMWGIVLACTAAVQNFSGAIAVRFFLGLFEAAVTPGFVLFTSQWYTKAEQGTRVGLWFCFNGVAQVVGGLVAYGVYKGTMNHGAALAPWRILFLVFGAFTAAMGVLFLFIMPDNQLNAWFLNKNDRLLALERIRVNQQGVGNKHFKMYQFKEAISDPLVWLMCLMSLVSNIPNGGITNYFSQLIVSFGYTPAESLLYGTPAGAVEVVTMAGWALLTAKFPNSRLLLASFSHILAIMGISLIVGLPTTNPTGRLAGYYFTQASATMFVAVLSLIGTNIAGYTKKTTVAAMYLICYCVGNIIGPQTFRPSDAPQYVPGEVTILVCYVLVLVDAAVIWAYCRLQNHKKAKLRARPDYVKLSNQEFLDLTDRENPEFIYTL